MNKFDEGPLFKCLRVPGAGCSSHEGVIDPDTLEGVAEDRRFAGLKRGGSFPHQKLHQKLQSEIEQ